MLSDDHIRLHACITQLAPYSDANVSGNLLRFARAIEAEVTERIARQWDGCTSDQPGGEVDIGCAIRAAYKEQPCKS